MIIVDLSRFLWNFYEREMNRGLLALLRTYTVKNTVLRVLRPTRRSCTLTTI